MRFISPPHWSIHGICAGILSPISTRKPPIDRGAGRRSFVEERPSESWLALCEDNAYDAEPSEKHTRPLYPASRSRLARRRPPRASRHRAGAWRHPSGLRGLRSRPSPGVGATAAPLGQLGSRGAVTRLRIGLVVDARNHPSPGADDAGKRRKRPVVVPNGRGQDLCLAA